MGNIIYGETEMPIPEGMTLEGAKTSMSMFFPELKTATAYFDGDDIRFKTTGGSKG